ncbi:MULTISPECIES: GntP family permease [unclassified Rathayibacter]|uniref:GntP family permease n=1 Tax=unclassified Rathayibacter TaxID=2609250 RepID=UPI000F4CE041|nr:MULTISPECIES: SLC13 family permease [unclassified Rathayibacter]MCJ1672065.1 GntP family permease [Rathayibacter sp. VKM Ac-2929]MCJ1686554.1 GntP family permease [Rathayibacter sp. VKM Ac-2927]ROP45124.1 H+/gluconate symporter-like permease [Rathayibacter sp. PhB186]ROS47839.1 H+/gluconate symporter-like permease [Rathayibacter sp. PhB185]
MPEWYTLGVVALVIVVVVVAIVRFRFNPVLALAVGAAAIGLLTGLGPVDTVSTMTRGFGEVMMEAGLLIGWGVLIGAMLNEMGAVVRLVEGLLRVFGKRGIPYALGLSFATYLQTIFVDALIVIAAPLARRIAPRLGPAGTGIVAVTFAVGLEMGIVMMVPGFAAVALAGLLGVPLGVMLLGGFVVVAPTVVVTILLMSLAFRLGFWDPARDEQLVVRDETAGLATVPAGERAGSEAVGGSGSAGSGRSSSGGSAAGRSTADGDTDARDADAPRERPLLLLFAPMLLALLLIAAQAVLSVAGAEVPVLQFLGNPVIALLLAVIATGLVGRSVVGTPRMEKAVAKGFQDGGQIFLLTGVGGALAAVIAEGDLGELLKGYFSANAAAPLLLVWLMAAVLHIAVGSVTLSAITAAGVVAPVAATLGLDPLLIALAAGSGALFCIHVTSNTFWLLQSFLGQSVRGALKSVTVGVSLASVLALGMVLLLSLFLG